jgi:TRAP-type C4-dicarboxylate transport system substrate-binding protein
VPEALAQKVIDGCVVPWEVVPAIKVQELVKYHTEIPGSPTLYTTTFVLAMNNAKYAALPADLKKVLDANSGQAAATMAAKVWDEQASVVEEMVKKRGNTVSTISADEAAKWRKTTAPVWDAWIKQVKDRGMDGGKMIENAKALIAKYEKA